ncbi:Fused nickel transport protein NikMN [Marinomonas aquimarina]|uniref:Fused nickel transport protein NikMN n=1 Tax=Marinomonas aquimarina TaxID=295068 RepID=A0A1A8TI41_9GAMM|nr:cobalt transporter CbiM [Marinomonas aquimarina]SBS33304.1 Fused nickel transport protein NikMN [Marinomonas aquimarina]
MHIVDGALSVPVLVTGAVLTIAGVAMGLKKMDYDHLPQVGVLSAAFFIASYIHLPIGFSSVHLILNGLIGLALGWAAFPALLVALFLQAVFFGFGGFVVLGVNTLNIALPAVMMYYLCRHGVSSSSANVAAIWGAIGGAGAIVMTTLMVALSLMLSGEAFALAAKATFIAHIPVMIIEGFVTAAAVLLIRQVKPEFLGIDEERAYG